MCLFLFSWVWFWKKNNPQNYQVVNLCMLGIPETWCMCDHTLSGVQASAWLQQGASRRAIVDSSQCGSVEVTPSVGVNLLGFTHHTNWDDRQRFVLLAILVKCGQTQILGCISRFSFFFVEGKPKKNRFSFIGFQKPNQGLSQLSQGLGLPDQQGTSAPPPFQQHCD